MGPTCRDRFLAVTPCRSPRGWSGPRSRRRPPGLGRSFRHRFAVAGRTRTALLRRIVNRGARGTNLGYLHGLCLCPAPSSVSYPADVRAADRACYAVCTSPVPPEISSSSVTKIIDISTTKCLTNSRFERGCYDFYRIPYQRDRYERSALQCG